MLRLGGYEFNMNQYKVTIIRPGGNDTALVEGIVVKAKRKKINDKIMSLFPSVEQVGFYEYIPSKKMARLEMAGGEFCGNATRSLAYLLLNGKKGEISIKVSGTKKILKAGVVKRNNAYAQMPIYKSQNNVKQLNPTLFKVKLQGITHLITITPNTQTKDFLMRKAKSLLAKNGLLYSELASGVMFIKEDKNQIQMEPIVWVRDIKTFFYETACASGTTAVGLWKARQVNKNNIEIRVKQPSKKNISVKIEKNGFKFSTAIINGPIQILRKNIKLNII